ncbi:DNA primase activity protein [Vibrio phage CAU_VPP01]|nr:DNA primase activity protein [Vibrio phage CAU_VPP01]
MNKTNLEELLQCLGVEHINTKRSGWVRCYCPLAPWKHEGYNPNDTKQKRDPNFGVKVDPMESTVNCFTCGTKGDLYALIMEMRHLNRRNPSGIPYNFERAAELVNNEGDLDQATKELLALTNDQGGVAGLFEFSEAWLNQFPKAYKPNAVHAYLAGRGITPKMAAYFDIRFDPKLRRMCFPIRGANGKLYGFHGRAIDKDNEVRYYAYEYMKQRNPNVWLNENQVNFDEPLVLCEGQFDVASIARVYDNVLGSQTSALNAGKMIRISRGKRLVSFYDYGTGGDHAREYLDEYCAKHDLQVSHIIPDESQGDAGDMNESEIYDRLIEHI